jgi:superfamily II DNA or RNA helicase
MSARIFSKPSSLKLSKGNGYKKSSNSNTQPREPEILTPEYREKIVSSAYLGKKGYTIPKSILSPQDETALKKELFVSPITHGVSYGVSETAFPVYRENANKIYLPRFYGISRYGLPNKNEIEPGHPISVTFDKPLRDYQEKIVKIYTDYVRRPICTSSTNFGGGAILEVPCGRGKCLAKNVPIIMFDGSIKLVQDVREGDLLMGDDSTPRKVLSLARGREPMYRISEIKTHESQIAETYVVNKSHILSLKHLTNPHAIDMTVVDYFQHLRGCKSSEKENTLRGYRVPIVFQHTETELDPYILGGWLFSDDMKKKVYIPKPFLEKYGLYETKTPRIPTHYIRNSRDVQLGIFAGMIDAIHPKFEDDGYYELTIGPKELYCDVLFLARSLGFLVKQFPKNTLRIHIHPKNLLYEFHIEHVGIDEYFGFEIDGNRRFLLGDFTVTHNTIMALNIVSILQTKTLILVHKEFLMNQWIERIVDFLPDAKVGKIQGQTFDIVDKDIVIGMIQTLYDREFPADAFTSFGLTIIDEVHRIGSEQFSKTLLRIVTPYMLGISATVERKDGLTKVLTMFIGDKIYSEDRENDDPVCVRAIEYVTNDADFNEVIMDYRGNPQYSSMISKLSSYNRRSDFIVRVIADLIAENPENQIMILAHQRSILTYMFDAIQHRNIATVGFYVGGMKQTDLQTTESKQIVLATYAMAAEALDIKTLSTLVMITPKTDIIQSVGRILRVKHDNPIIVDIVDKHDVFQKQWVQRRRFYKKCGYRIRQIESHSYQGMSIDWETDKTWKRVFEPTTASSVTPFLNGPASINQYGESDDDTPSQTKPLSSRKCLINIPECFGEL